MDAENFDFVITKLDWPKTRQIADALAQAGRPFALTFDGDEGFALAFDRDDFATAIEEGRIRIHYGEESDA